MLQAIKYRLGRDASPYQPQPRRWEPSLPSRVLELPNQSANLKFFKMRTAFKEWAVVVDALGRGEQILILRKGGIHEGKGGFQVEHRRFWLFPTLYHQQGDSVLPQSRARFVEILPHLGLNSVDIEFFAEVVEWRAIQSIDDAHALRGQHIWRDEVIAERFNWGKTKSISALAVRVFRLPRAVNLHMMDSYGGCKSWIELEADLPTKELVPVLSDAAFAEKLKQFQKA